ncbi:Fe-S cluster assembly protein SufD [Candidatus Woesearchaeota archaeon]|nr:Fe-S cluster assembly protein SufD [Candidatus Woesearchaeota archaeon]
MKENIQCIGISIQKEKEKGKELFKSLETPILKYGQGMQISLKELDLNTVLAKENEEERMSIDAPKEVRVLHPSELSREEQDWYWEGLVSYKENKFLALHQAILNDARIIIIPKNINCKEPIKIKSHVSKKAKAETIIVIVEQNASAIIIEENSSEKEAHYKSQVIQVYAKEDSSIEFCTLQDLSTETYNFTIKRGRAERNAKISWRDMVLGGKLSQLDVQTNLICPQAQMEASSGYFGKGGQVFDLYSEAKHMSSSTECTLYNRGVLCNGARTVTRGKIIIEKNNSKCKAKQKSDNLIIGKNARCDAVPILEVENDDVSCFHGATITHLDEEQLFYLSSRGIELESAKAMIIAGYLEPIINTFPNEEFQEKIREKIWKRMENEKL